MIDHSHLQQKVLLLLEALQDYEILLEGECPGPVAWSVFDPNIGLVASLRLCYPPHHQLPDPGQQLYRNLWGSLPAEQDTNADSPLRPEDASRILHHLDRFRAWLVRQYKLASTQPELSTTRILIEADEEEDFAVPIPPEQRTRPMSISEAGHLMGHKGNKKQVAKIMKGAMTGKAIRWEKFSRQRYVFDRTQFCQEVHSKLAPTGPNSP
jgi:hypothetical protein